MSILFTIQPLVPFVFFVERNMLLLLDLKRNHKLTSNTSIKFSFKKKTIFSWIISFYENSQVDEICQAISIGDEIARVCGLNEIQAKKWNGWICLWYETNNVESWERECQSCCLWWWYTIKERDTLKKNGSIVDVFAAGSRPTYYPTSGVLTPTSKFKSTSLWAWSNPQQLNKSLLMQVKNFSHEEKRIKNARLKWFIKLYCTILFRFFLCCFKVPC